MKILKKIQNQSLKIDESTIFKVIFLDIDGVMNHAASEEDMDSSCLYELKRIVDATDGKIVLTSSWRLYFLRGDENPIKQYFEKRLHLFGLNLFDISPNLGAGKRAAEIKHWLKEHKECKSFVIIDDIMFPGFQKMHKHLCITDWNQGGLTRERADLAIQILNQN